MTGPLESARRIVVKIGSSLLVDPATGALHATWLDALADDIAGLAGEGREVLIVSSGAIALGRRKLGLAPGALKLEESQAAAAVGQVALAHAYEQVLASRGLTTSQILLTFTDTEERRRYLNARNTIATLLRLRAVPVVNENDTVATSEIRYGDNDRLAARVASMISADCLVLLSDVDGLYTASPRRDPNARRIDVVEAITPEIEAMAGASDSDVGSGGMITKLAAARIALDAGTSMVIVDGHVPHPLKALRDGAPSTWFRPGATPVASRKKWIAGTLEPRGTLVVDAGAARALGRGNSLLPAGVVRVDGQFGRGDAVLVADTDGTVLGRGLSAYDCGDAARIAGYKSGDIENVLGYRGRDEMIHRDDLVLARTATTGGNGK